MDKHITLVAILNLVFGLLQLLAAAIVFVAVAGGGVLSGDPEAMFITSTVATAIAGFLGILAIPAVAAGLGLLARKPWARILTMIVAIFDLFWIPIGTAIGIYELWVMMDDETVKLLSNKSA